ncbi:MAG: hypothetical protein MUO76_12440 [Anaerolineaceae bacterium]|nr:hypothetical protein [Anaerolineaceae bacterium]
MDNAQNFGENILKHIHALAVDIGPRPVGTACEERGREYITNLLQTWGIKVEEQSVNFAPLPKFYLINFLMGAILIVFSRLIKPTPTLTIWLPLIYVVFTNS